MRFIVFAAALLLCGSAYAHVTANPNTGLADNYFETKFRVSHGCDGSATTAVTIKMPQGIVNVKPQFKPGWTAEVKKKKLPAPVNAGHGKMTDEQVDEITWRGGPLPDDQYDEFGIVLKLPDSAGSTLYFPVTQTCEKGKNEWYEIPSAGQMWHDLKSPAPFVKLEAAPATEHHH